MKTPFRLVVVLVLFGLGVGTGPGLRAAPFARDLGDGLGYFRIQAVPADLPSTDAAHRQPLVVDLRFAKGGATAGAALDGWVRFHAAARTPIFLLINAETEGALTDALAQRLPAAGIIVIGTASPGLTPDLALKLSAEDEKRAYDALAAGTLVENLLNDSPEKSRNDEARLAREQRGQADAPPASTDDSLDDLSPLPPPVDKTAKPKAPPPLIDIALQRAVQLHRSLKALKKL